MSTATTQAKPKAGNPKPRRISKEEFLREYTGREDGYKYEWNDGLVEKTNAMNQQQSKFFILLLDLFLKTNAYKTGGRLLMETDMDTTPIQLRRPDISYYTAEQLPRMWAGENQIAPWLAEIISPNDKAEDINKKLVEYFQAGVQVVWHIFPDSKQVYVYTSPDDVTICRGKTVCSGTPVLPDLDISADELFA